MTGGPAVPKPAAMGAAAPNWLRPACLNRRTDTAAASAAPLNRLEADQFAGWSLFHPERSRENILIDPGFGFGKNVGHNLELMNGLALFHSLGCPLVIGTSRKRTIGALSGEAPADKRLGGSIAFAMRAAVQGAQILRVHDVFETVQALKVWRGMRDQALTPRV